MQNIRLDLSSPSGNAFHIMGAAGNLGKQMGMTRDEIKLIQAEMMGIAWTALGGAPTGYEHVIATFHKHFPFVELYSKFDLGIDPDLYVIDDSGTVEL